eukprot:scaffold667983_cov60-Prasinocladus_malaysianus.AAC.1
MSEALPYCRPARIIRKLNQDRVLEDDIRACSQYKPQNSCCGRQWSGGMRIKVGWYGGAARPPARSGL